MYDFKEMINTLSRYWWSPKHPSSYTVRGANGQPAGIGLLAHENPAAFNICWAIHPLVTFNDHRNAIMSWSQLNRQLDVRVGNEHLDFAITSRTREEFKLWYKLNRPHIRLETRMFLDKV
jgi:hypothetical protein